MKRILVLLTIAVTLCFCHAFSERSILSASVAGDSIAAIRSRYATINRNLKRYKKVEKELSGYSTEGGTLEAYFDGGSIKKLVARFFGEMGKADEEYYFWNDKLIFVFRREVSYDAPFSGKVVSTKDHRFYFDNNRLIRWIDESKKQVAESDPAYQEKQKEYLENAKTFMDLARS